MQAARARLAKIAEANLGTKHFLIIDEINRANLGKVLGELLLHCWSTVTER